MAGADPLNEEGSPPHCEAQKVVKLEIEDKMVQKKIEGLSL